MGIWIFYEYRLTGFSGDNNYRSMGVSSNRHSMSCMTSLYNEYLIMASKSYLQTYIMCYTCKQSAACR